jgi:TolA-binding protein
MGKRKTKKQSAKATLAEVIKEMAKRRVASSAREQGSVFLE